jgi:hypothetical protein
VTKYGAVGVSSNIQDEAVKELKPAKIFINTFCYLIRQMLEMDPFFVIRPIFAKSLFKNCPRVFLDRVCDYIMFS